MQRNEAMEKVLKLTALNLETVRSTAMDQDLSYALVQFMCRKIFQNMAVKLVHLIISAVGGIIELFIFVIKNSLFYHLCIVQEMDTRCSL